MQYILYDICNSMHRDVYAHTHTCSFKVCVCVCVCVFLLSNFKGVRKLDFESAHVYEIWRE